MKTREKIFMVVGTVAVMAAAGVGGYSLFAQKDATPLASSSNVATSTPSTTTQTAQTDTSSSTATSTNTATSSGAYKDGTYTATASYMVPHGSNTITTTIMIANGTVTAVSSKHGYADRESGQYIDSFDSSVESAVVGKSINGLSIGRIGGASLTSEAFSSVLDTLRTNASS